MWPFYLLFNKILKLEEPRELGGDDLSFVEVYPFESFLSKIRCDAPVLPRSQLIEVSLFELCFLYFNILIFTGPLVNVMILSQTKISNCHCLAVFFSYQIYIEFFSPCQVPHINQLQQWDCGLACVLMVLNILGINGCDIQSLADLCGTRRCFFLICCSFSSRIFSILYGAIHTFQYIYISNFQNDFTQNKIYKRVDIVYFHDASFIFEPLSHDESVEHNSAFRKEK